METQQRFDRVVDYLLSQFEGGNSSVSKEDVIDEDGTVLVTEAFEVLRLVHKVSTDAGLDQTAIEALDTFVSAWASGFDLANGNDLVSDDESVEDILRGYREGRKVWRVSAPSPSP